ncbi:unnamed protein product [Phytophthora lilii]|uniref:Unnamed protein product n=1 Tax=Phytophthora lilii TaxID=2077276 RepID=A0A9W7CN06_9STRA|nr:unnamed protein product [Phytophthora lilii]
MLSFVVKASVSHGPGATARCGDVIRLQSELFRDWHKGGDSPAGVFSLLDLDRLGDKLVDSPLLATWLQYTEYFSYMEPKKKVTMISLLRVHVSDGALSYMLIQAKQVQTTKKIATQLQNDLLSSWMTARKRPAEVDAWLHVEGTATNNANRMLFETYANGYKHMMEELDR